MRLVDLDDPKVVHLIANLEPKWKPMAEFGKDGCLHELGSIAEALDKLAIKDMDEVSDGYHAFNSLYEQRLVLFATLVNAFSDRSWKSHRHSDGKEPFGGGYFIVGIDTPKGSYTCHYKEQHWDIFHCQELDTAPEWDGHTDKDVRRLLSLVHDDTENPMIAWATREVELAVQSEKEAAGNTEDWKYGVKCYESALRAYKSLWRDDISGTDIRFTRSILNRMMDGLPLTPIEDTPDIWNEISSKDGIKEYQCRRISSLFRKIEKDGTVSYHDVDRAYGVNVDFPDDTFGNGIISQFIDRIFPIVMPYLPSAKKYFVRCEKFLADPNFPVNPENGGYDTIAYLDILTPDGRTVELNRYFKDDGDKMVQIDKTEYDERKARKVEKK